MTNLSQLHSTTFLRPSFIVAKFQQRLEPVLASFAKDLNHMGQQDIGVTLLRKSRSFIIEWHDGICLVCGNSEADDHDESCELYRWLVIYEEFFPAGEE
jgi:hypothetical protein